MKFTREGSWNVIIERMTQEEKADLIDLIIGKQVNSSGLVQVVFDKISESITHNERISKTRSESGKQGGRGHKKEGSITHNEPITQEIKFAEFVQMSESEHEKLVHDFGGKAVKEMIEAFNNRVGEKPNSKERRNRKAYFTIRNRLNRDAKRNKFAETTKQREQRLGRIKATQQFEESQTRELQIDRRSQLGF